MKRLGQDIRYGLRLLRKTPGFTAVALLTLALGVGANTAIFTPINVLFLKTLPGVSDPQHLVLVTDTKFEHFGYPYYEQFCDESGSFAGLLAIAGINQRRMIVSEARGELEPVLAQAVSGNFFSVLGVPPAIGRTLTAGDDLRNQPQPVAVLSYDFWRRRFGLDPTVIGATIMSGDVSFHVVGVAKHGFAGVEVGRDPDLWFPIQMLPQVDKQREVLTNKGSRWLRIMGRLKPNAVEQKANAELDVILQRMLGEQAAASGLSGKEKQQFVDLHIRLRAGGIGYTGLRGQFRRPLVIIMTIGGLVLLVACTSLAGLLLSRGAARQREFGIRVALGAGRGTLVRQFVTEGLLLAIFGGVLGLFLSQWGTHLLAGYLPGYGQTVQLKLAPDLRVLAFTLAISALTGVLFTLIPAWHASRVAPAPTIKGTVADAPGSGSRLILNRMLVVCQIALSCLLLIAAGLFVRTLRNFNTWDPGFNRDHLLVFGLDHPQIKTFDPRWINLHKEILRGLESVPGVQSASLAGVLSLSGNIGHRYRPKLAESATLTGGEDFHAYGIGVGLNYLKTMGIPLLKGRDFGPEDEAPPAWNPPGPVLVRVILSKSLAGRLFGQDDPIGKQLRDAENPKLTLEVVGVAGDAHHQRLKAERLPTFYHLDFIWPTFYVRTQGRPSVVAGGIREAVRGVDPQMTVTGLRAMDDVVNEQLLQERTISQLASFFSLFALVLACLGLYGILSYNVVRQTREIGIRMALGAKSRNILFAVIRQGMILTIIGCVIGSVLALILTRFIASLLHGVTPIDPITFIGVTLVLIATTLLACSLPAYRAARIDPMMALRLE